MAKKAPRQASKKRPARPRTKAAAPKKRAAKKASSPSRKKSAPPKSTKRSSTSSASKSRSAAARKGWETRRARELAQKSDYARRDAHAREKGYESYWDERQSRVRARKALADLGIIDPSIADVDQLGTLGRGESARELYYKTKRIMERYEPAPTDRQIWALIRIFYKPRSRR